MLLSLEVLEKTTASTPGSHHQSDERTALLLPTNKTQLVVKNKRERLEADVLAKASMQEHKNIFPAVNFLDRLKLLGLQG